MSSLITEEDRRAFLREMEVTDEEIRAADCIDQKSSFADILKARGQRLSASNAGAAAGHNPHKSKLALCKDMLWPKPFKAVATEYGNAMESTAYAIVQMTVKQTMHEYGYETIWFETTGTRIWKENPWLCASADGLVRLRRRVGGGGPESVDGVLELKAPWRKEFYETTPHYYYDQFHCQATFHGADFIVFGVYTPDATQVNYFHRDANYWDNDLFPKLRSFYMDVYLPRAIYKRRGLLKEDEVDLLPVIQVPVIAWPKREEETEKREQRKES